MSSPSQFPVRGSSLEARLRSCIYPLIRNHERNHPPRGRGRDFEWNFVTSKLSELSSVKRQLCTDLSIICLEPGQRLFLSTTRARSTSASRKTMRAIVACNSSRKGPRITRGLYIKEKERFVSNFRNVLENILNIYLKMLIGDRLLDLVWMIWIWGEYRDEYMVVRILYFDFGI